MLWLAMALAAPTLKLVEPGAEPRAPLALTPPVGQVEQVAIDLTLTAEMVNEGIPLPSQALPPMHLGLRAEVLETTPTQIRYALTVTEAQATPSKGSEDLAAAMSEAMTPMLGIRGVATITPFGARTDATWDIPPEVDPGLVGELERALGMMHGMRPTEPVGVGAVWTLTETGDDLGFVVTETETWTLAKRSDNEWLLQQAIAQSAEPQTQGENRLDRHFGAGTGEVQAQPGHLLPSQVALGLTTRTRMTLQESVQSTTTTGVEARIQRKD